MADVLEIKLQPVDQLFNINLNSILYHMRLLWNDAPDGGWTLDISDEDDVPLIFGIPLVSGADLLEQYKYLNIGGGGYLYCYTDGQPLVPPTHTNLGENSHLLWQSYE